MGGRVHVFVPRLCVRAYVCACHNVRVCAFVRVCACACMYVSVNVCVCSYHVLLRRHGVTPRLRRRMCATRDYALLSTPKGVVAVFAFFEESAPLVVATMAASRKAAIANDVRFVPCLSKYIDAVVAPLDARSADSLVACDQYTNVPRGPMSDAFCGLSSNGASASCDFDA